MGYHDRIVSIHACLVEKCYNKWAEPGRDDSLSSFFNKQCVLFVMDVHKYDLETAIKKGLSWSQRFRVSFSVTNMPYYHLANVAVQVLQSFFKIMMKGC